MKKVTCYKIDSRCPCSPRYRGHWCDSDCMLKNYGKNCGKRCDCDVDHVCHHVTGTCYLTRVGRFQIVIKENFTNFDEMVRRKQLKLNVAVLIAKYNNMYEELRHLSRRRIPVTSIHGNISIVCTQITETIHPATRHDFLARILDLKPGLTSDGSEEVVAINVVMFDGEILLNGIKMVVC
ncbi:uncharacterized protein LOC124454034 [Xenia sp. Carnegie-2017]|uniref:uncharacterized protein LOC124454034 n=1 Tax=Xenia sp. Carnegie-2017 TaxID=2897299 RepID=UPI001F047CAA|nr:uncharacterized protein LOC124454034 [Xenia sp. Carnegie-2017]